MVSCDAVMLHLWDESCQQFQLHSILKGETQIRSVIKHKAVTIRSVISSFRRSDQNLGGLIGGFIRFINIYQDRFVCFARQVYLADTSAFTDC